MGSLGVMPVKTNLVEKDRFLLKPVFDLPLYEHGNFCVFAKQLHLPAGQT